MFEPKGTQYKTIDDALNAYNAYHGTDHVRNCSNAESIGFYLHVNKFGIVSNVSAFGTDLTI